MAELPHRDRVRRGEIEGPGEGGVLNEKPDRPNLVLQTDPGKPLSAIADGPSYEEPVRHDKARQDPARPVQHQTRAEHHTPNAGPFDLGGHRFHPAANVRQETAAHRCVLIEQLIAPGTIVTHARCLDDHRGSESGPADRVDDGPCATGSALQDAALPRRRPPPGSQVLPGQVDDRLRALDLSGPDARGPRIPLHHPDAWTQRTGSSHCVPRQGDELIVALKRPAQRPTEKPRRSCDNYTLGHILHPLISRPRCTERGGSTEVIQFRRPPVHRRSLRSDHPARRSVDLDDAAHALQTIMSSPVPGALSGQDRRADPIRGTNACLGWRGQMGIRSPAMTLL